MQDPSDIEPIESSVASGSAPGAPRSPPSTWPPHARFSPEVVAFGTYAELVHGLDDLESQQWRNVWPLIEGFPFRVDELVVIASPDGCHAVAVVPWDSVGRDADGIDVLATGPSHGRSAP